MATKASQSRSGLASTSTMSHKGITQQQRPSGMSLSTSRLSHDPTGNKSRNFYMPGASRSRVRQDRNASATSVHSGAASGRRRRFNDTREIDVLISEMSAASRKGGLGSPYGSMSFAPSTDLFANGGPAGYTSPYIPGSPTAMSQTSLRGPSRARFGRPGALSSLSQTDVTGISKISKSESGLCRITIPEGMGIGVTDSPYPIFTPPGDIDPMKEGNALRGPAMTSNPDLLLDSEMFALGRPQVPTQSSNSANQGQESNQSGLLPGSKPSVRGTLSDSQTPVSSVSPNPGKPQSPALSQSVKDTADDALPLTQSPHTSIAQPPKQPGPVSTPPRPSATSQPNRATSTPARKPDSSKPPTTPGRYFGFRQPSQPEQNPTTSNGDENKRKGLFSGFFRRIKTPSKSKPPPKMHPKNQTPSKSGQMGASNVPSNPSITNKVEPNAAPVKSKSIGEAKEPMQIPKTTGISTQDSTVQPSTPSPAPHASNGSGPPASPKVPFAFSTAPNAPASQAPKTNMPATSEPLGERTVIYSGGAVPRSSTPPKPSAAPEVAPHFSDTAPKSPAQSNLPSVQTSQIWSPAASNELTGAASTYAAPEASPSSYVRLASSSDASVPSTQYLSYRRPSANASNASPYLGISEPTGSYAVVQPAPASSVSATKTVQSTQAPVSTAPTMSTATSSSYAPADAPVSSYPDWSSYTPSSTYYQSPPSRPDPVQTIQNSQPKSPVNSFTRPNVSTLQAQHPIYTQTSSASASYPQAAMISRMPSRQGMSSEYQQHPASASSPSTMLPPPSSNYTNLPSYLFTSASEQPVSTADAAPHTQPLMAPPTTKIYSAPSLDLSSHPLSQKTPTYSSTLLLPQAPASSASYLHHAGSGQSMTSTDNTFAAPSRGQDTVMLSNGSQLRDATQGSSPLSRGSGGLYTYPSKSSSSYDSATEYGAPSPTGYLTASTPSLWPLAPIHSTVNNSAELSHTQGTLRDQAQWQDEPRQNHAVPPHISDDPTPASQTDDLSRVSKHSSELDGSKGTGLNLSPSLQALVSLSLADEPQFTADVDVLG